MIVILIIVGLASILSDCARKPIDVICPPAGQCPNVTGWHTAGGG
jgi:hypothetical protein